jgi:hypothetical protein
MNDPKPTTEPVAVASTTLLADFLRQLIAHNSDTSLWGLQGIVDTPEGEAQPDLQFGEVYVEQHQSGDNSFYGYIWYPLPCGNWLQTYFS